MRVARLHGAHDLRIRDEDEPGAPPTGYSTVRVTSVGICGSDLHWFTEGGIGDTRIDRPVVPGHEFAGVALDGPHAGRRVAVDPAIPCGVCEPCRAGHGNLCLAIDFAGQGSFDGALRERLLWPDELLFPVPDAISDDGGALLEPLGVAIHAIRHAHVRLGDDVLVVGAGSIGLLSMEVARVAGARRVFATEPLEHRREAAARNADEVWTPDDAEAGVLAATGGRGVDVVIEAAGSDPAIDTAVAAARPGARIALAGIPDTARSSFPASGARRKGLTFTMIRRMHATYPQAIHLATNGIDLDALVSDRYPLDRSADAFEAAARRVGTKTVVSVSAG